MVSALLGPERRLSLTVNCNKSHSICSISYQLSKQNRENLFYQTTCMLSPSIQGKVTTIFLLKLIYCSRCSVRTQLPFSLIQIVLYNILDKVRREAVTQMAKYFTCYFIYCEKILALIFIPKLTADEYQKRCLLSITNIAKLSSSMPSSAVKQKYCQKHFTRAYEFHSVMFFFCFMFILFLFLFNERVFLTIFFYFFYNYLRYCSVCFLQRQTCGLILK